MLISKVQRFWWQGLIEHTKFICIKISFSWYLVKIVAKVVSSQGAVISLITFSDSPETSLKVMPYQKKRWKILYSIRHYFGSNYRYHLPSLLASQPFVHCCKIVVIEDLRKFVSFIQRNRTTDWHAITTNWCEPLQQEFI